MPSGSSIDCGDVAKGERIGGFIFFVGFFVARIIAGSLANYGLLETSVPKLSGDGLV
jgi:hypothetical protein